MANSSIRRRLNINHRSFPRLPSNSLRKVFRRNKRTSPKPEEWISWKLGKPALLTLLVFNSCLIATILFLLARSYLRNGFVTVQTDRFGGRLHLKLSLLWVSLPPFVFQLYNLCIVAVVDAFGFRQPFVELNRGAKAEKSITLEYRSYFLPVAVSKAFSRGHWRIAIAFIISFILKAFLTSLAAHIVVEQTTIQYQKGIAFQQDHDFYATSSISESLDWDLSTVLELTSASLLYNSSYPRWSNGTHTFLNFSTIADLPVKLTQVSVKANTKAYFANMDCEALSDVDSHLIRDGTAVSGGTWSINGTDRGCDWTATLDISDGYSTYLRTSSHVECGEYGASSRTGRMVIMAATNVDFDTTVPTVLSCLPIYWTADGSLSVNLDPNSRSPLGEFDSHNAEELRPQWWTSFEGQLNQVTSIDPTNDGGTASDSVTTLGRIMLTYARQIDAYNPLSDQVLEQAVQQTFKTVYSILVDTYMIKPAVSTQLMGEASFAVQRLFVDNEIAGVIVGFLVFAALLLVLIYQYTHDKSHTSMLFEEPVGLLGFAGVLCDSVVNKIAVAVRETQHYRGKTVKDVIAALEQGSRIPNFFADPGIDPDGDPKGNPRKIRIGVQLAVQRETEDEFVRRILQPRLVESDSGSQLSDGATEGTSGLLNHPSVPAADSIPHISIVLQERHAQRSGNHPLSVRSSQVSREPQGSETVLDEALYGPSGML